MSNGEKPLQIFSDNDLSDEGVGTLSDYIAQHLKKRQQSESGADKLDTEDTSPAQQYPTLPSLSNVNMPAETGSRREGLVLHHLDSELINDHIDSFMPNSVQRFYAMRDRLASEITAIENEIKQYEQFTGPEYRPKIEAMQNRKEMLVYKLALVDEKIQSLNPFEQIAHQMQRFGLGQAPKNSEQAREFAPWRLIPNRQNQITEQMSQFNTQMKTLKDILDAQLHDPNFSADQLGRLVSQYDTLVHQADKLASELSGRKSLREKLNQHLDKIYTLLTRDQKAQANAPAINLLGSQSSNSGV